MPELIRAYERGTNRTLLLEEALLSNRNRGEELPDELVNRLFRRPSGEAHEIPAWHEGGEEPFDVAVLAGALNTDQDPVLALFVFDDEVCLLYSSCSYNSPVEFDIKRCPRTACFEAFARRVHLGEVAAAATPDEDDTWLASEESFSDDYRPFAIDEPLRGTACQKYERRASWPITMTSTAVDMLLEALFDGRRLITWTYFFFEDRQNNAPWPPWGPPCPGPDIQFSKLALHMYLYLFEDLEEDLPGLDLEKPAEPAEPEEPAKPPAPAFAIGARVEARYNGGESWYPGKIFTVHPDGSFYIKYDDGDEEDNIPASDIRPEPAAEPVTAKEPKPAMQSGSMLADLEEDSSDGEVSLRQVTPPAEEPAAAQPEQEEDILAGLDDLGLNTMSVSEPPPAEKPPAAQKPADEFDYDELEADLFGGSDDAVKPGTAGTRPTTVDSRDYDDSRPSTYDSRSYSNRAGTAGTDGYSYSNYDSRPETREPESKPGTAGTAGGFYDYSRPQTEGTDYNFDDDFSDFEI